MNSELFWLIVKRSLIIIPFIFLWFIKEESLPRDDFFRFRNFIPGLLYMGI